MRAQYLFSIILGLSNVSHAEERTIIKFNFNDVQICEGPNTTSKCYTKKRSTLPNPKIEKLKVLDITKQGMVKTVIDGKTLFTHQIEVKLSGKAITKNICGERVFESSEPRKSYGTHGLVGECDE
ncbi:hypothetical protein [Marinomonas atlantica]|uniref:hypothetical protein n=1 Tax=Marinomonas atlantica TaxID=1806668 RepID=UPI00082F9E94|nr:hypothetical protein [Marinomonas atlantica]